MKKGMLDFTMPKVFKAHLKRCAFLLSILFIIKIMSYDK